MELEYLLISSNKEEKEANWEYLHLSNVIEVEIKTTIECRLVMGIIILLNTASITL